MTLTTVPNGDYTVEFWVWEDTASVTFTPSLNGATLLPISSGPAGSWRRVGPLPVTVTGGQIVLSASGAGANFSGIRVNHAGPVGPPSDTTAPTIVSTVPANGATGVDPASPLTVTFSEPVAANGGVTVITASGATVPATVTVSGSVVTVAPVSPLAANTRYRLRVTTAVTDLAGNPLAAGVTNRFTTR